MKDSEAVALYHQAISVTPGEPTEFGADMWCDLLRDLRYEDARDALINLLRRSPFASPAEIRTEVAKIRTRRIQDHPELVPPADLSVPDELAWRRDAIRRIGDGEVIPDSQRGELVARDLGQLMRGRSR